MDKFILSKCITHVTASRRYKRYFSVLACYAIFHVFCSNVKEFRQSRICMLNAKSDRLQMLLNYLTYFINIFMCIWCILLHIYFCFLLQPISCAGLNAILR